MSEDSALRLSAGAAILIGCFALWIGLSTGSGAILLDAAFNISFFVTALFAIWVAHLLRRPSNIDYPFGYIQFAPLANILKSILILATGLLATIDAVLTIIRGGETLNIRLMLVYASIGVVFCGAVYLILRFKRPKEKSALVEGDIANWFVNTTITLGMLVAFTLTLILEQKGHSEIARLVDPILVILVVLGTAPVPIIIFRNELRALLLKSPEEAIVVKIRRAVTDVTKNLNPKDIVLQVHESAEKTYILVHILLNNNEPDISVGHSDIYRDAIRSKLEATLATDFIVKTLWTGNPEMMPGFVAQKG